MVMLPPRTKFRFHTAENDLVASDDRGSVTAELAMALPAMSLVIAITLGAFALQIERMKLVDVAATAARAVARGESQGSTLALISEMTSSKSVDDLQITFETRENMSCVVLSRGLKLPGLGDMRFDLSELQCARKMGL